MDALRGSLRIDWNRWVTAQQYETGFWQRLGDDIARGTTSRLDWYQWRAARLEQLLAQRPERGAPGRIVEIGSGPIGIVNFLDGGERYAIDPLEHFYREQPSLVELRRPGTTYIDGTGEQLPFDTGSASLVIIDNVIDHTYAPDRILDEIARVLTPDGRLYLVVNVHTAWGARLHDVLAALRVDPGHPYTFTSATLRTVLARHGFAIDVERIDPYEEARDADRRSSKATDRIKGYSGLSEFQHLVLCSKRS